ncbi:DUF4173 domain-containing protein [Patescibacteria group bacterium]|nr:DUF4173 domain-containing protein [Patescibacteria group bacterium]MBU1916020.1 DUF4173 domain-containing protein [Patescibacteria group bacterium]
MEKYLKLMLLASLSVSVFWTVFLWNFWSRDFWALGANAFVYLAALVSLFLWVLHREGVNLRRCLYWVIPIGLIILSFLLYDNPFLKTINILVLPVLFAIFYNFSLIEEGERLHWDSRLVVRLVWRTVSLLGSLVRSARSHVLLLFPVHWKYGLGGRIVVGVAILLIISATVVVPLLASADTQFAAALDGFMRWFQNLISTTVVSRILLSLVLSVGTTAALIAWGRKFVHAAEAKEEKSADSVIAGIVLGGILALYLLFLILQLNRLVIGSLPFEFKDVEQAVKSGFWQLLVLSVVNIVIFLAAYRKTVPAVQKMLLAFAIASILLLASAAQRMGLYVIGYGFSYEKLFASYTVLFCAILFGWLIYGMFTPKRVNILKFLIVLFAWMYGILTMLPIERFIFSANLALAQREDTRIRLYEMTMLSPDVLGSVRKTIADGGGLGEPLPFFDTVCRLDGCVRTEFSAGMTHPDWGIWITRNESLLREKAWYEKNLSNFILSE